MTYFPTGPKRQYKPKPVDADDDQVLTHTELNMIGDDIEGLKGINRTFTGAIVLDVAKYYSDDYTQTGILNFTASDITFGYGSSYFVSINVNGDAINFDSSFTLLRNDYEALDIGTYDFYFFLAPDGKIRVSVINIVLSPSYVPVWTIDDETGLAIPTVKELTIVDEFEIFVTFDATITSNNTVYSWGSSNHQLQITGAGTLKLKLETVTLLEVLSNFVPSSPTPSRIYDCYYSKSLNECGILQDNVLIDSGVALPGVFDKTNTDLTMGARNIAGVDQLQGDLFSVRVFDRKLSVSERNDQYVELLALKP